jgi:hypothetical protein
MGRSPADFIRLLTYQSGRKPGPSLALGFTCGSLGAETAENRAIAKSLVELGHSATPDLEDALDSVGARGGASEYFLNSAWLFYAYARIEGPAAYRRLWKMVGNPELESLEHALDASIALSFGITSYVDDSSQPVDVICRPQQPRDSLDRLILAWQKDDRQGIDDSLGPKAKAALASLLAGRTWAEMRAALWPGKAAGRAEGYHLDIPGRWSEPEETLGQDMAYADLARDPVNPEIKTTFRDRSGINCGEHEVKFLSPAQTGAPPGPYLIDNFDVGDLLRVIASCAARGN